MKRSVLFFVVMIVTQLLYGQDTIRAFFDKNWEKTTEENAMYYRKAFEGKAGRWIAKDFYMSGKIQMIGQFQTRKLKVREADFTFYYENGQVEMEGIYVDGNKEADWPKWYSDGTLWQERNYEEGKLHGEYKEFYKSGKLQGEGIYKHGKFDQDWKWYFENGQQSSFEQYENTELKAVTFWNEDGNEETGDLTIIKKPMFVGGIDKLHEYVITNFGKRVSNRTLKKDKNKGKIVIQFVVNTDGSISNIVVLRGINKKMDAIGVEVIQSMPKWNVGKRHNIPIRCRYTYPIRIL